MRWVAWNTGLAALLGAAGVALAAVAAHGSEGPQLATAAQFLMVHGAAALALTALAAHAGRPVGLLAGASLMIFAAALFSGDLAARTFLGTRLFPFATPTGGSLLVVAWLVAGIGGLAGALKARAQG